MVWYGTALNASISRSRATDEGQRRRLHAAHGQQGARAAALRAQRVRAAEVHADQPVGALPPACSVGPACIGGVLLQRGQAALDGNGVLRAHPKAAHRLAVAEVLQHFVNQQLAFAVGVAGVDDLLGLLEQLADHGELLLRVVLGLENPALGDDGQLIDAPDLLAGLAARHVIGRVLVGVRACSSMCPKHQVTLSVPHSMKPSPLPVAPSSPAMALATDGFSAMKRRMVCLPTEVMTGRYHGLDLRTIDRAEVAAVEGCGAHVRHKQHLGIAERVAVGLIARQRPTGLVGLDRRAEGQQLAVDAHAVIGDGDGIVFSG